LSKQSYDFSVKKVELNGDKEVNHIIKERLINLKNQNSKNKYYVQIETSKVKNIISNDSKGDPSKLEIIISSTFQINNSEKLLIKRKVKMKNIYNNISDKLKLKKYESFIINNLSQKISDSLISTITNVNDN
jgi:predicted HTH domain antitoxin